jgi:hypothetical protein
VEHVLAGAGRPLEPALRREMQQRFGWDFSRLRVHLGPVAEQSARDVNARAYTVGDNLVFGAGEFEPETLAGRRLLAHGGNFRGFLIDARDDAGRVEAWARSKWYDAKDILDGANLPLRRAMDEADSIRNDLMAIAKQERPSAGVLVAIDYLKAAQGSSNAAGLKAVKRSLSVLEGIPGVGRVRLRLALLKGKLEKLSSD